MRTNGHSSSMTKQLTPRQLALAKNLLGGSTITEAARRAGYSEKNLAQSGHQALKAIRLRAPEVMDDLGLTERTLIEKHLVPNTKLATRNGEFTDYVELENHDTQLKALDIAFRLHGAYAPKDPKDAAQFGVKVVIIDVPRPQLGVFMPDIKPGDLPPVSASGNRYKPEK
jgi:hypothetical protein